MLNFLDNTVNMYKADAENLGQTVFLNNDMNSFIPVEELDLIEKRLEEEKQAQTEEMNKYYSILDKQYVQDEPQLADKMDKSRRNMSAYKDSMSLVGRQATGEEASLLDNNNSLKRQVQISINAALKRNQIIYILKVSLLAVGVSIIPPVLLMHRKISKGVCIRALIAIVILWALFVASTLWSNVNRHPLYFDRFIFKMSTQPTETSSLTWEERASLNKTLSCYDASKDTAEKQDDKNLQMVKHILKSLKEKKTAMVEEEDFRSADELAALIREVETGLATGDSKAGFSSIGTLSARVNQINSRKIKTTKSVWPLTKLAFETWLPVLKSTKKKYAKKK